MVKTTFFREELEVPKGVKITVSEDHNITVKGPNGEVKKDFSHIRGVKISQENGKLIFSAHFPQNKTLALTKTIIHIIQNLITGVQTNYTYVLMVCYSHFPCNVEIKNDEIQVVNFLGERAPRKTKYDKENVKIEVKGDEVFLEGPDKEKLGQIAANIKKCCRIRKKDPRVFQDGVYLYKKMLGDEILWQIK
ncbi:MAG: 50S ribosomal protein L6 [Candidatus Lokiarchaeota archaeon]|nr:50S ribosomal protein L6 [Candidatus Lokiarchaeota archaeon]